MRQSRIIYEEIYKDAENAVHEVSVWLRRLNGEAPYTLEEFTANQTLGNVKPATYCGVEMAQHLVPINQRIIEDIKILVEQAIVHREHGLVQFLSNRLGQHQEWDWFLQSSLKLPPNPWKSLKD